VTEPEPGGPLAGLRVVDCSSGEAGTRASGLLADYGADVIWVEPPGGDPERHRLRVLYAVTNRGKRSVTLDLSLAADVETLWSLLSSADVFLESWAPGQGESLGFGYDAVHDRAPHLVVCSVTGFGPEGPWRDVPAREALVHSLVGTTGEQVGHREAPIYEGLPFASIGAGYLAVIGMLAAVYRRQDDGIGRHVETSLLDGALAYLSMMWGDTDAGAPPHTPGTMRLVAGTFLCADDEYLGVHTGAVGAFSRLMKVLGLDARIASSGAADEMGKPLTEVERDLLSTEIHKIFATAPRSVWLDRLRAADVCAIEHLHPGEVFDQPQVHENGMVVIVDDPFLGPVEEVGPPVRFSRSSARVGGPAPRPGEHTKEVIGSLSDRSAPPPAHAAGDAVARPLLEGLTILDLGAYYAGPYSSRLLADLGADVIKLEPVPGDPLRGLARPFRSAQAGKRSIALNLKDPDLVEARDALVDWADVIHHNMRPGAAERLGLGFDDVSARNPRCVYVYAPGWGTSGPDRDRQSFAPLLSGFVGIGYEVAGRYNPPLFPVGNEDPGNGLLGAVGMLMALVERQRSGAGQYVVNPQLNATMTHMAQVVRTSDKTVLGGEQLDPLQFGISALDRLYPTSDGWICVVATGPGEVDALARVVGGDFLADPAFADLDRREANDARLGDLLADAFASKPTAVWLEELAGAGIPAVEPLALNNALPFLNDPVQRKLGRTAECPDAREGRIREVAALVRVSHVTPVPHRVAPDLGGHTSSVLRSLGYDEQRIKEIEARGSARLAEHHR
jgi:crotonobetainyl-CoA:carnitine CoA-transferase CaiB-like acyl-CoA transferase